VLFQDAREEIISLKTRPSEREEFLDKHACEIQCELFSFCICVKLCESLFLFLFVQRRPLSRPAKCTLYSFLSARSRLFAPSPSSLFLLVVVVARAFLFFISTLFFSFFVFFVSSSRGVGKAFAMSAPRPVRSAISMKVAMARSAATISCFFCYISFLFPFECCGGGCSLFLTSFFCFFFFCRISFVFCFFSGMALSRAESSFLADFFPSLFKFFEACWCFGSLVSLFALVRFGACIIF